MEKNTYNGWYNFETWKVNLEFGLCDGGFEDYDADMLKEHVEEMLETDCENSKTLSYALCFISECNFNEIERHIKEEK